MRQAEREASRLNCWNTNPIRRLRTWASSSSDMALTSSPASRKVPEVGTSRQPRMCMRVDLPEPDGPMMATYSPVLDREGDPPQRLDLHTSRRVGLPDVCDLDDRRTAPAAAGRSSPSGPRRCPRDSAPDPDCRVCGRSSAEAPSAAEAAAAAEPAATEPAARAAEETRRPVPVPEAAVEGDRGDVDLVARPRARWSPGCRRPMRRRCATVRLPSSRRSRGRRWCCSRCSWMAPVGTTTTFWSSSVMMDTVALEPP